MTLLVSKETHFTSPRIRRRKWNQCQWMTVLSKWNFQNITVLIHVWWTTRRQTMIIHLSVDVSFAQTSLQMPKTQQTLGKQTYTSMIVKNVSNTKHLFHVKKLAHNDASEPSAKLTMPPKTARKWKGASVIGIVPSSRHKLVFWKIQFHFLLFWVPSLSAYSTPDALLLHP